MHPNKKTSWTYQNEKKKNEQDYKCKPYYLFLL